MIQQRASERAAKKAGDTLITLATDPRMNNLSLTRYLEAQRLPDQARHDVSLMLVMTMLGMARDEHNVVDESIYQMIGPYYRQYLLPGTE